MSDHGNCKKVGHGLRGEKCPQVNGQIQYYRFRPRLSVQIFLPNGPHQHCCQIFCNTNPIPMAYFLQLIGIYISMKHLSCPKGQIIPLQTVCRMRTIPAPRNLPVILQITVHHGKFLFHRRLFILSLPKTIIFPMNQLQIPPCQIL